jgi:O-antigen/teichoic acid export membrane protein
VLTAVRARLSCGALLAAPAIVAAFAATDAPWFWTLCVLQVVPNAFDLKNLLDAAGRAGAEVVLETAASLLHFVSVVLWLLAGGQDLTVLAGITLATRCVYAAGALPAIAALPHGDEPAARAGLLHRGFSVSLGQTAHALMAAGDVWLVAVLFGETGAGLYATAQRLAASALLPSAQLARLLLPHLLRAAAAGSPQRTTATALRATLFATLPMVAGGAVVAPHLCALFGDEFVFAAPALRLVLLGACLQHLGWQCSHALLAAGRDRAFAASLWWPAVLHALLLGTFAGSGDAAAAALAMLLAQGTYLAAGLWLLRGAVSPAGVRPWLAPLGVATATAAAAAAPALWLDGHALLAAQLAAGGGAFTGGLWLTELRGRLRRLGDGLAAASGFRG